MPLGGARRYRCQDDIQLPFKVLSVVNEASRTRMECNVTVRGFCSHLYSLRV